MSQDPGPTSERPKRNLSKFLPYVSLTIAVVGAVTMNRSPTRARIVAAVCVVGFVLLWAMQWVRRRTDGQSDRKSRLARLGSLILAQSSAQQSLYFAAPFFIACRPSFGHAPFFAAYLLALVAVSWDPLYERVVSHPVLAFGLQTVSAWWGLIVVLPIAGVPVVYSHIISAGLLLVISGVATKGFGRRLRGVLSVAAPIVVMLGAPWIPAAPLAVPKMAIGTAIADREVVSAPGPLHVGTPIYCHTAIRAPVGLRDELFHVWRVDGKVVQKVRLEVSGGREAGFRTWSTWSRSQAGEVTCTVETRLRQPLGSAVAEVR